LNIENNKIGNDGAKLLLEGLARCKKLRILNISKNNLSDTIAQSLYSFILSVRSLDELILHWNYLGSLGL
jgi:Ran GTPase-activating protein (RanGAP) involved in mRNA processing and transport